MISLELMKEKRTGVIWVLLVSGIIGAFYVILNFVIRGEILLNMPADPMDILLTQLYGMLMVLNMFSLAVATSITYNMEFTGTAIKKMYVLPICMWKIYVSKFFIIIIVFMISIIAENIALAWIGITKLSTGTFEADVFISFMLYSYVTSLPVASFMLLIASLFENIWVTIGIGVGGFLSGMALVNINDSNLMMIHPFIIMFKPAIAMSSDINTDVVCAAIIELVIFFVVGVSGSLIKKVE